MKKYLQISAVLGIFSILVLFRQFKGNNDMPVVGNSQSLNPSVSPVNTNAPTLTQPPISGSVSSITQAPVISTPTPTLSGLYKNGNYTGSVQDAFYGNVQVQAIISGGKIKDIVILQYPSDNRTSQYINSQAMPMLKQEAIQAQSANINMISGASASSPAFQASLADALSQAKP